MMKEFESFNESILFSCDFMTVLLRSGYSIAPLTRLPPSIEATLRNVFDDSYGTP